MPFEINVLGAYSDNFIWVITNKLNRNALVIDPGDGEVVIEYFEKNGMTLKGILVTHNHQDHTAGIKDLLFIEDWANVPIYCSYKSSNIVEHFKNNVQTVSKNSVIDHFMDIGVQLDVLELPGHTIDSIGFYIAKTNSLFTGDTLFTGGCGNSLLEKHRSQLFSSLKMIKGFDPQTKIYCGHFYLLKNLQFAKIIEEDTNPLLNQRYDDAVEEAKKIEWPIHLNLKIPPLQLELDTNPFLRTDNPNIKKSLQKYYNVEMNSEYEVFSYLRKWKDYFYN